MLRIDIRRLRNATRMLLLPPFRPAPMKKEPSRFPDGVLGCGSPANFVRLAYDGGTEVRLSATDAHLTAEARVRVKATGTNPPWVLLITWWRWSLIARNFSSLYADLRITSGGHPRLTSESRSRSVGGLFSVECPILPASGAGLPNPSREYTPPCPSGVADAGEVDAGLLCGALDLFATVALPAPRYRTELGLYPDGRAGAMVGAIDWSADTGVRLPFPFSPASSCIKSLRRWVRQLPRVAPPGSQIRVTRHVDTYGRTYHRLSDASDAHSLWVPVGRTLDPALLDRFTAMPTEARICVPIKPLRWVADVALSLRPQTRVEVSYTPGMAGTGTFALRGFGPSGPVEDGGPVSTPYPPPEALGWAVTLSARRLLAVLAPFPGPTVMLAPVPGGPRRLVVRSGLASGGLTATVACDPHEPPRHASPGICASDRPEPGPIQ